MQLQHLCSRKVDADIKNTLDRLPPKLSALYGELYDSLSDEAGEMEATIFRNALHWLLSAQERLSTEKFLIVVTMMPNGSDKLSVSRDQILDICNNFVVHDSQLDTFRFAHLSVREFLEGRTEFNVPSSNGLIAEACLWAVLSRSPTPATQKLLSKLGWISEIEPSIFQEFEDYADYYWPIHCKIAQNRRKSGALEAVLKHLFLDGKNDGAASCLSLWIGKIVSDRHRRRNEDKPPKWRILSCRPGSNMSPSTLGLFVTCAFDFEELGQDLLVSKALTTTYTTVETRSPVALAAAYGSSAILSHLIMQEEFGVTHAVEMVEAARTEYCEGVVTTLITLWKADEEARKRVLTAALSNGLVEVIKPLLDSWKDVTITQDMMTAVLSRPRLGTELMDLLLEKRREDIIITQELVEEIVASGCGDITLVKKLIQQSATDCQITQNMVESGLKHHSRGSPLLEFLLSQGRADFKITQKMVEAAVGNTKNPTDALEILLSRGRADIKITQEVVEGVIANSRFVTRLVDILLRQSRADVITAQNMEDTELDKDHRSVQFVELLLNELSEDIVITARMVKAAVSWKNKNKLMKRLLIHPKRELPITTPVLGHIVREFDAEVIAVLLDKCELDKVITDDNVDIVAEHSKHARDVLPLFVERQGEVVDFLIRRGHDVRSAVEWYEGKRSYSTETFGPNMCRIRPVYGGWIYFKRGENGWKTR
jgi:hypothetical protein